MSLAAAPRPLHGRAGSPCTIWPRRKGEHVRLDWKGEETPSNMHDVRAAAAPLALKLEWTTLFSYRFFAGKHINLLELESLISLLRRITRAGKRRKWLLVLGGFARGLGSRLKRTVKHTKNNFLLRKLGFWCFALELVWVPTWANPADLPSRNYIA